MQAKSGKKITAVKPGSPEMAEPADESDPGKVEKLKAEQVEKKKGKYGKVQLPASKPAEDGGEEKTSWIEFEMVDEDDQPVAGVAYKVKLPDGSETSGHLDGNGFTRIESIDPGQCEISFPELDKSAWEKI